MSPHAHPLVLTTFCLVKALISGCWLFGNRCLKPAKYFRHQTKREVERHSPFLPQIQLLNSLSLESNTREKRKLHEENRFNCIGLVFAIHCFWAHHVDRQDVKNGNVFMLAVAANYMVTSSWVANYFFMFSLELPLTEDWLGSQAKFLLLERL